MLLPKAKMRVNLAVKDYIHMFPDDYKGTLELIERQKQGLDNDMAELKSTHAFKRLLGTMPVALFEMIQKKLNAREMVEFKTKESQRWFYTEHPQFRVTEHI